MRNPETTRFIRLGTGVVRTRAENQGTRIQDPRLGNATPPDLRTLFNQHHRRVEAIQATYTRPGLAVFALTSEGGVGGHLWLEASENWRAGTIGRHSAVDLFLPADENLSLRHLLLLVSGGGGAFQVRVVDLATPTGFVTEEKEPLRALAADGPLVFGAARYLFVALPTGEHLPWDPEARDPWSTLPRRLFVPRLPPTRVQPWLRQQDATSLSRLEGPTEVDADALVETGESVSGHLVVTHGGIAARWAVGSRALARGVILGRYERCTLGRGSEDERVSRVHAVILALEGVVHIVDAGSMNGVTLGEAAVHCAPMQPAETYALASMHVRWMPVG